MTDSDKEILELLRSIHDLLVPISAYFKERYAETQHQRSGAKLKELEALLTYERRNVFPLLFDPRRLSQVQIAKETNITQPTVSRFISALLEHGLIEKATDETGTVIYKDKYNLRHLMETLNERS